MKRVLPTLLLACAAASGLAQQLPSADIDLFGDAIVTPVEMPNAGGIRVLRSSTPTVPKPPATGFAHGLIFHDGRTLRGELVAVTKTEIVWRRPDADAPLRFSRDEVRKLILRPPAEPTTPANIFLLGRLPEKAPETSVAPATIKLPGGDWLYGDLRSTDGQKFTLKLAGGLSLEIARESLQWLYFGKKAVPASGFVGDPLSLESWLLGNTSGAPEFENGVVTVSNGNWLGRSISPPARFEVEFSVPKGDEQNTRRVWLQPFSTPQPNSYSTGTVVLTFAPTQFTQQVYTNGFNEKTFKVPKATSEGPTSYRIFYDDAQITVFRQDIQIAEVSLAPEDNAFIGPLNPKAPRPNLAQRPELVVRPPSAICIDSNQGNPFKLQSFLLRPWNGVLPGGDPLAGVEDQINREKEGVHTGAMGALTANAITFGGQSQPRAEGTFVRFGLPPTAPAPTASGDALLFFGAQGELSAANLEIADGHVKCRTGLGTDAELPVEGLEIIAFARRKAVEAPAADVLVFRNGDTLRGTLVGAARDQRLRWRTGSGQELTLETSRIAGVRLNSKGDYKAAEGVTVELRNGDRYRGALQAFDQQGVRLKHALLGERKFEQASLWNLLLNPKLITIDAGADPQGFMGLRVQGMRVGNNNAAHASDRVYLDGKFLNFGQATGSYSAQEYFSHQFKDVPERYEIRAEATDSGGTEPYLTISLAGNSGTPSVQASVAYGQFRLYAYNISNNPVAGGVIRRGGGQINRTVALEGKLPESNSRRTLRAFVDTKLGTVDFFVNGAFITKLGQQAGERCPGVGANFNIYAYMQAGPAVVLSDLQVCPWNGEVPRPGDESGAVYLNNGDSATGRPAGIKDGKLTIEGEIGRLDVPLDRITNVQFGGAAPVVEKAAARLRLRDGAIVHVDDFHWENGELKAHSAILGDFQLPTAQVMELILAPTPIRFPTVVDPKKLAKKEVVQAPALPPALPAIPALPKLPEILQFLPF